MKTQRETLQWAVDTFGEVALSPRERALRFIEEALELAQAENLPAFDVLKLVNRVYNREPGTTAQEIAGVYITLQSLAENAGVHITHATSREWDRIAAVGAEHLRRKQAEKVRDGVSTG